MTTGTQRMTATEFLDLPPDRTRSELIHGEMVPMSPSPTFDHGYAITQLIILLGQHVGNERLGQLFSDLDCYFSPDDVRRPDLLFFATNRLHLLAGPHKPRASPDLCIEVLSPSNPGYDRTDKFETYQAAAVPFYWIVDPIERTLEAYKLVNGLYVRSGHGINDDLLSLPPFETFSLPLGKLWRPTFNP